MQCYPVLCGLRLDTNNKGQHNTNHDLFCMEAVFMMFIIFIMFKLFKNLIMFIMFLLFTMAILFIIFIKFKMFIIFIMIILFHLQSSVSLLLYSSCRQFDLVSLVQY